MYTLVDTTTSLEALLWLIENVDDYIYCDIETTGLDWSQNKILLFQCMIGSDIFIVDVRQLGYDNLGLLAVSLNKSKARCVFHNAKFDIKFIAWRTGILLEKIYDTMTVEAVLMAGIGEKFYSLKDLVLKYLGEEMEKESRSEFIDFPDDNPFTESMLVYSAKDVHVLKPIVEAQNKKIEQTYQQKVTTLENDLIPVVAKMELNGIRLDVPAWLEVEKKAIARKERFNKILKGRIIQVLLKQKVENAFELAEKAKIPVKTKKLKTFLEDIKDTRELSGWLMENFNEKSPHQMKAVLVMSGLKKLKDTNEKTLQDFSDHKIVRVLLKIRGLNKQIDSYGSGMLEHIKKATGKIHTEYYTVGTATGRFSSNKPNLQQVPTHGGYRECFIPDEGYVFVGIDYSQQEYRLAGAVSRDPIITKAYQEGSDMHTATGKIVAKKEEITKDERNTGKTVNFAILYGSTEYGLKRNLDINVDRAVEIINDFWNGYKYLSEFMKRAGEKILELGFSSTPYGRRRYNIEKPLYCNSDELVKWQARVLREGRNHIIQGGGADIIKIAMLRIHRENPYGDKLQMLLQIHDEILSQVHESIKEEGAQFIRRIMEEVEQEFLGAIPAKADGWNEFKTRWSK